MTNETNDKIYKHKSQKATMFRSISFLFAVHITSVACSTEQWDKLQTTQQKRSWYRNGYEALGNFCKDFDKWKKNKRIDEMSSQNYVDYDVYVRNKTNLCQAEKVIYNEITNDLREQNQDKKNPTIEYKNFYALFAKAINIYLERHSQDDLEKYLLEPYTDEDGNQINKEELILSFIRSKASAFLLIGKKVQNYPVFCTRTQYVDTSETDYECFFFELVALNDANGSLTDKIRCVYIKKVATLN